MVIPLDLSGPPDLDRPRSYPLLDRRTLDPLAGRARRGRASSTGLVRGDRPLLDQHGDARGAYDALRARFGVL